MPTHPQDDQPIAFGVSTQKGTLHANNQDSFYADVHPQSQHENAAETALGLFMLADGMGGMPNGDQASRLAIDMMQKTILESIQDAPDWHIEDLLEQGIQAANRAVHQQLPRAGTTLTAVALWNHVAYIGHVGDSRVYKIGDDIEQLTHDHSIAQQLVDMGQITHTEAKQSPQSNSLYRAIGQESSIEVNPFSQALTGGVTLLLCSDGLWHGVDNDTMQAIIQQTANPDRAAEELVKQAVEHDPTDDITALVVQFHR